MRESWAAEAGSEGCLQARAGRGRPYVGYGYLVLQSLGFKGLGSGMEIKGLRVLV